MYDAKASDQIQGSAADTVLTALMPTEISGPIVEPEVVVAHLVETMVHHAVIWGTEIHPG